VRVHMFVHVCMRVCVCVHMRVSLRPLEKVLFKSECVCVPACVHMCVCTHALVCVCVCVCVYVCVCMQDDRVLAGASLNRRQGGLITPSAIALFRPHCQRARAAQGP